MAKINVIDRIKSTAKKYPNRPALHVDGNFYSYAEFIALAKAIQVEIEERGYIGEEVIGVLTGDDIFTCASIIAIIANGSAYLPINKKNPCDRNVSIISQANARVVLASSAHAPLENVNQTLQERIEIISTFLLSPLDGEIQIVSKTQDDLLYLLFTSGSTGVPKGVPIYNRNLNQFLYINIDSGLYEFTKEDRFLQMFELTFDFSVMTFFVPLSVGACCYMVPSDGIAYLNIIDVLEKQNITVAPMVPSVLAYIERYFEELKFESLRYSIFCGEPLTYKLIRGWAKCIPNAIIQNAYGPTEATVYCLSYDITENSSEVAVQGILPIGKPFPGMNVVIIDEDNNPMQAGQEGELCLSGLQVTDQYWKDEVKTRDAFFRLENNSDAIFYKTGDRAFLNNKGDYIYCGRMDSQVKIDGHRVELGEIENVVRDFTNQSHVAAVVSNSESDKNSLKLFLTDGAAENHKLENYMKSKFPPYMIPREIIYLNELPLNQNGKIDRKKLSEL